MDAQGPPEPDQARELATPGELVGCGAGDPEQGRAFLHREHHGRRRVPPSRPGGDRSRRHGRAGPGGKTSMAHLCPRVSHGAPRATRRFDRASKGTGCRIPTDGWPIRSPQAPNSPSPPEGRGVPGSPYKGGTRNTEHVPSYLGTTRNNPEHSCDNHLPAVG